MSFIANLSDWLRKVSKSFTTATISNNDIVLTRHNNDTVTLSISDIYTIKSADLVDDQLVFERYSPSGHRMKLEIDEDLTGESVDFGWDSSDRDGALLALRSSAYEISGTAQHGWFLLIARDANNTSQLVGKPTGELTWGYNKVITIVDTATTTAAGVMSASDKTKLDGISDGAEVNQDAFSYVKIGSDTIAADAKTDTLELVNGDNVVLTADTTNDKVTIDTERHLLPATKYTLQNIFANPPMSADPQYGLTYKYVETGANEVFDANAPYSAVSASYHVLTFEQSRNRALQIAGQTYVGRGQNLFFRGRHIDNNDYSQWQQWYRLAKSDATGAVGSATQPVYLNSDGTVTACNTSLDVDITGNAAAASSASRLTSVSVPTDKDLISMTPTTVINVEGTGFSNVPEGTTASSNTATTVLIGSSNGFLNSTPTWTRGFWLHAAWNRSDRLWIGRRTSSTTDEITWTRVGLVGATCPPQPNASGQVGDWWQINVTADNFTLPSGGTWAYMVIAWNSSNQVIGSRASVAAGGTVVTITNATKIAGFRWRIA